MSFCRIFFASAVNNGIWSRSYGILRGEPQFDSKRRWLSRVFLLSAIVSIHHLCAAKSHKQNQWSERTVSMQWLPQTSDDFCCVFSLFPISITRSVIQVVKCAFGRFWRHAYGGVWQFRLPNVLRCSSRMILELVHLLYFDMAIIIGLTSKLDFWSFPLFFFQFHYSVSDVWSSLSSFCVCCVDCSRCDEMQTTAHIAAAFIVCNCVDVSESTERKMIETRRGTWLEATAAAAADRFGCELCNARCDIWYFRGNRRAKKY